MADQPEQDEFVSRIYPIKEDIPYQCKVWRFERIGWYVLLLIMLLTLLGVFSKGPISSRHMSSADGLLSLEYEIFQRYGSESSMVIRARGEPNKELTLLLTGELLDGFSIETLQPDPLKSATAGNGLKLTLLADEQGFSNVFLTLRADGVGLFNGQVAVAGKAPLEFTQFIYP